MTIDICIPTYEANGYGHEVLEFLFRSIEIQKFKSFRVLVADHSVDNKIKDLCENWKSFEVKYIRNERGRGIVASNLNVLLDEAKAETIKWMDQDDYFLDESSLGFFDLSGRKENWIVTSYLHTRNREQYYNLHQPMVNNMLYLYNTIGTMSCTSFKNVDGMPRFDEALRYSHDCDLYHRYWKRFGDPVFLNSNITIANFIWTNSFTSQQATPELIVEEADYLVEKYASIN
jgi:glycosyltransferase involved in cell wall biosynthesis